MSAKEICFILTQICRHSIGAFCNTRNGIGDFVLLRNALKPKQIQRLETLCAINSNARKIEAEKIEERYVFDICEDYIEDILEIPAVEKTIKHFVPEPHPRHFMRNLIVQSSNINGSGGGWHRDSFEPQIKLFIPLVDTNEDNGALQYVRGSSGTLAKLRDLLIGRRQSRNFSPSDFDVLDLKRGDLAVVNTSGIHRGGPAKVIGRDMVTIYFNETFEKLNNDIKDL